MMLKRFMCYFLIMAFGLFLGTAAFASPANTANMEKSLNIITTDNRPLYIDRLLYTALRDMGYSASFTVSPLQDGYASANNGDGDGVIAATPNLEALYPNLVQVPVVLDNALVHVYTRTGSGLSFSSWGELSGLDIGLLSQRVYIESRIPDSSDTITYNSTKLLLEGLANRECDVAVVAVRSHETFPSPEGVEFAGELGSFPEYLYMNKKHLNLLPDIASSLYGLFAGGRGESIINDRYIYEENQKKTILHIVSSDTELLKEDHFKRKLTERFSDGGLTEWYTMPLNTKRFSSLNNRLSSIAQLLRQDCVSKNIAAIVVSGDDALEFTKEYYFLLFRNVPVLFNGISADEVRDIRGFEPYFTGIVEHVSAYETVSLALDLFPGTKNIYALNDYTAEGQAYRNTIEEQLRPFAGQINIIYSENLDRDSLLSQIKDLSQDSILLVGSYFRDGKAQYFPMNDMVRALESSCDVPVFSLYSADIGYNAIGGKVPDTEMYGEAAADMLQRLLAGEKAADIPIVTDSGNYNRWAFDEIELKKFGINKKILPPDSLILNEELSIWKSDPRFVITLLTSFIIIVAIIITVNSFQQKLRKQMERLRVMDAIAATQHNLQTIIDTMPAPVRITDSETHVVLYANNACAELFGYSTSQCMCGKLLWEMAPEFQGDGTKSRDIIEQLLDNDDTTSIDIEYLAADGRIIDSHVTICTIEYNGRKSTLGMISDLTAEREYESMLLNAAQKEKEANLLKSRFLVNMSHEIRTPMNAVIGLTEIELRKKPDKETREIYQKINSSAKNLLNIINDILDLSKIEADKMEIYSDEFELEEVLNNALLVAVPRLDGKNVEFILNASLDLPRFVTGDKTRLWQILKNFLDNSAKYTETGKIVLTVFADNRQSDGETVYITFSIADTGIGLNEEQVQRVFMPYEQIYNSAQERYTGTGLGMVISKQLCELMGGKMQIESKLGEGTTIHLGIPFKRSESKETGRQLVNVTGLAGIKILAVDDDELSLSIMSNLIGESNAACDLARSGSEAMDIILDRREKGESYDLILLDYMMDGLNGLETAAKIQTGLSRAPKLLMVTAYQRLLLKQELEKYNISDVIEKPFIPSKFIHKICETLGIDDKQTGTGTNELARFKDAEVLLCEDFRLNQEIALGMLEQFGVTATVAENGKEGIDILNTGKAFDLILMDLQMPVMDGYEATRIIRADKRFDSMPIISLTADAMKEVTEKCIEMGMNDHVAKPIEFDSLQKALVRWLPESKRVKTAAPVNPNTIKPDSALARFGGNKARYENALAEFAETLRDEWPDFGSAIRDMDETKRYVHKIKGAAGNLSEDELYQSCVSFEASIRNNAPDKDMYERLVKASGDCKTRIAATIKTGGDTAGKPKKTGTAGELKELLGGLKAVLDSYDLKKISAQIDVLEEKNWPADYDGGLQALYKSAKNYDYDAALDIIKDIEEKYL